jgi:hypothetical protein
MHENLPVAPCFLGAPIGMTERVRSGSPSVSSSIAKRETDTAALWVGGEKKLAALASTFPAFIYSGFCF